ncbi:MAG: hypothetical protein COV59_01315 [Candidatus Magasanikbacteria bacterium CG11_big_fil_rev_8_21_14_0_20_39_34]|uniref:YoaR-like putative peptidoglycan binding domain-containing protein n=1 Tax=Candidatus Magasanikbacteria bacterium CG11_big_fil_rev_8_21_14_0_20_39_34 TaxID=1974653 RepID=A0A2H0N643_9BACT|nr:MAG: hypothetical protein COV59_01315 [Candidatus Magasanikbacteria bacterium CG11_big_fil_rev_8_21_14_0_20_39_34]
MKNFFKRFYRQREVPFSWRRIWVVVIVVVALFAVLFTGLVAYAYSYGSRVLPNTYLGTVPIGGLEELELKSTLENMYDKLVQEGMHFRVQTVDETIDFTLYPVTVLESGDSLDLLKINVDKEVQRLLNYGKRDDIFTRAFSVMQSRIRPNYLVVSNITVNKERILEALKDKLVNYEQQPQDAYPEIKSFVPFAYEVKKSHPGVVFHYDDIIGQITTEWSHLRVPNITLSTEATEPKVTEKDIEQIQDRLAFVFNAGPLEIMYADPETKLQRKWKIDLSRMKEWLEVQKLDEGRLGFGFKKDLVEAYFKDVVSPFVNISPKDAKFEMGEDGKVIEFQTSRPGVKLDTEKTYENLNDALLQRSWHDEGLPVLIQVSTEIDEPNIKTGEVNDLGIVELLGVGISDFSGSAYNRILNIKNGAKKLNGLVIKPGEEFSAIKYTQPYTLEGGYLPEKVIKGDEIKPEIGGGLCQIGTTLFRMAMNSGMKITERRNHSLVVHYYNDPVNNLPGTDATIYEPAPDFKFLNDTDKHILIETSVNEATHQLVFKLWGTSDGRKGSYTHPVVHAWIPAGEPKTIETEKLEPGKQECQSAFTGARTSFTYTRILGNGTKEEEVFESYYRPLPKICLVGVEPKKEGENPVIDETELGIPPQDTAEDPVIEDVPVVNG